MRTLNRFHVFAKNTVAVGPVRELMEGRGFCYDSVQPEFIVSLGGDGTFLMSERAYPGVPKLLVRDSLICFKCHDEPLGDMLAIIQGGHGRIEEILKLEACMNGERLVATNDVVIRNVDPRHALRFSLVINGVAVQEQAVIGDGIVVATPFGSTGYYHSVGRETLQEGIGVAFNNPTNARPPLHLDQEAVVELTVSRGQAHLATDNAERMFTSGEGDTVRIAAAPEVGRLVGHD